MGTHASLLAGEIPRTEEPGGLQSVGSQDCINLHTSGCRKDSQLSQNPASDEEQAKVLRGRLPGVSASSEKAGSPSSLRLL